MKDELVLLGRGSFNLDTLQHVNLPCVFLPQEVTDLNTGSIRVDGNIDGEMSIYWSHLVLVTLKSKIHFNLRKYVLLGHLVYQGLICKCHSGLRWHHISPHQSFNLLCLKSHKVKLWVCSLEQVEPFLPTSQSLLRWSLETAPLLQWSFWIMAITRKHVSVRLQFLKSAPQFLPHIFWCHFTLTLTTAREGNIIKMIRIRILWIIPTKITFPPITSKICRQIQIKC